MKRVVVVDYGMGNLRSVSQAVAKAAEGLDFEVRITQSPADVRAADRVVLPGQGAMPDCMRELRESGLMESVLEAAASKPLFGVCVGMQMLLERSLETFDGSPFTPSLGLLKGEVVKFDLAKQTQADGSRYKVPHMGWNKVSQSTMSANPHPIWAGVTDNSYFYFVHSFYAKLTNPLEVTGTTDYGSPFTCAIAKDNIFATQFHPEKSATQGLALYRNFLNWKI